MRLPGREADHSPPISAGSIILGSTCPLPNTSSWRNAYLVKHRDNFTFATKVGKEGLTPSSHLLLASEKVTASQQFRIYKGPLVRWDGHVAGMGEVRTTCT
jgi:hypothetical protein